MRLIAILMMTLLTTAASAQVNTWTAPVLGNWADPSNWDLGHEPTLNEIVQIENGATIEFTGGTTPLLDWIVIAPEKFTSGDMEMSAGSILADVFFVGYAGQGSLVLSGTGSIITNTAFGVGIESGTASGSVRIEAGTLDAGLLIHVGNIGYGEFILNGGSVTSLVFIASNNSGSTSDVKLSGGTLAITNSIAWGNNGHSDVTVNGATITADTIDLGPNTPGSAEVLFDGGSITCREFRLGYDGDGVMNHFSGTLDATRLRLGSGSGIGYYIFEGGTILADELLLGASGFTTFTMTGGTLSTGSFAEPAFPRDLTPSGGFISPEGSSIGTTTIHGNLVLGAAAALDLQVQSASDQVVVNGTVQLNGSLNLSLESIPTLNDLHTLLANDGADPIVGTFSALPEGAPITLSHLGLDYEFVITYLGGDGNDVTLEYPPCPVDFTGDGFIDNGDIGAFLFLFISGDLSADVNGDGFIDNGDISAFISLFLAGC